MKTNVNSDLNLSKHIKARPPTRSRTTNPPRQPDGRRAGPRRQAGQVAAKLQRVAKTLFGVHQQGLARERLRTVPAWHVEVARRYAKRRNAESRLVQRPTLLEVARRELQESRLELGRGIA